MSLARAFTSKRHRHHHHYHSDFSTPQRSASARVQAGKPVMRSQISAPVQLLSTTNMLSFNAPDLSHRSPSAGSATGDSDAEQVYISSPATSMGDPSPIDSRPVSPESKHLSSHFQLGPLDHVIHPARQDSISSNEGPVIPARAPSHTKATHRALARQRSQHRVSPPTRIPSSSLDDGTTAHPFGKELEQVDEVAEEFGLRGSVLEEEERLLRKHGLQKFAAHDYIAEIEELFGGIFEDVSSPLTSTWI